MSTEHQTDATPASPSDEAESTSPPKTMPSADVVIPQAAASAGTTPAGDSPAAAGSTPDSAHDSDDGDDGDDAEGEGEAKTEGSEAGAVAGDGGDGTKKKRRRRRRKKKGEPQLNADGTPVVPVEGAPEGEPVLGPDGQPIPRAAHAGGENKNRGDRDRKKKDRAHEERERPAFNHGDVVFGKVLEFNDDILFIDLSGKAKAIFDLRELLITDEDEAQTPAEDEHEEGAEDPHAKTDESPEAHADEADLAAPAEASPEGAGVHADAPAAEAPAAAATPADVVAADAQTNEGGPVASPASPDAGSPDAGSADKPAAPAQPLLPRVILEPGAPFVGVVHNDGGRGGLVVLTHHPKRASRAKPAVSAAFRDKTLVWGIVTGVIKGGVEVDVDGLRGFAPGSHMDLRLGADLHHFVGKRMAFAVTEYGKRGHNIVLSRKSMLEETAKEHREEALKKLEIGATVEGIVRTVVQFGAFVDVGGVEGLVPLSEMSHNRGDTPRDVFKVGEKTTVKIMRVDEKGKLWLSHRATISDPWSAVAEKYAPGSKHTGKIARLQPFGAFIELEPGVDGLIHTADLSMKRIEHPSEVVKVGDPIDVVVAQVDPSHHKIGLHPAPTGEASGETPQRVQLHKVVKVQVMAVEASGLVVRVLGATGRSARGFITGAGTGAPKGAELRKIYPVGKELEAKITEIDPRRGDMRLSIKAVNEDNERNAFQQYRAQVKREAKFGTLADLLKKVNVPKE
jgi:small subunit ribosomal protein S1